MDNDFLNRTAPDDHQLNVLEPEYPTAQWSNGYAAAEGSLGSGGVEFPLAAFDGLISGPLFQVPHKQETVKVPGYILPAVNLCILRIYVAYWRGSGENREWSATPDYKAGFKSRWLLFCYAAEIEKNSQLTPFILSLKSTIAQQFEVLLKKFRSEVLNTADSLRTVPGRSPHYLYYLPVGSTGRVHFPNAAKPYTIAPPMPFWEDIACPDLPDPDKILRSMAIPGYLFNHIQSSGMAEAKAWKESMIAKMNGGSPQTAPPPAMTSNGSSSAVTPNGTPPVHEPAMPESQAIETAQGPALSNAAAEKLYKSNIAKAIAEKKILPVQAAELTSAAPNVKNGWLKVWIELEGLMKAQA